MPRRLFPPLLTLLGLVAATAGAASFDCKLARGNVEAMICADSGLSALDERLDAVYARWRKAAVDDKTEKAMQIAWLKTRNACQDAACVRQAYQARIAELQARSAGASPLAGIWKKEYACDQATGPFEERCRQGQRDKFQLSIIVHGDRICALHVVWANMGNRVDEVEDRQPSMTGKVNGNVATVGFRSTWDGTGTATMRVEGNTLHWKVTAKDEGESWIPDDAVLQRVPADRYDRMPDCAH